MKIILSAFSLLILSVSCLFGQVDTIYHRLVIKEEVVEKAGKPVKGMTINGTIPGPTLKFKEGAYAVIEVVNEMDVETSVHWHGLLLPNFQDGVPYLTTPPIMPGKSLRYEFPLIQSGTYWYHSHTMLQEQKGVYGSIIIDPAKKVHDYDHDQVIVLSDWTNQKPGNVLRNLKRGNEWYNMKKGTSTPLSRVIAQGGFGAQLNFWRQRMEGADIADVYYPAFLVNGEQQQQYSQYKPGERIRLRIINAAASTQFWLTFGGKSPMLISADGLDVEPVPRKKLFIGIAETYDLILTIPHHGQVEMRAMAQDGSGTTQAYFGKGELLAAEVLPRPDKIEMMKEMAKMDMRMGAPAMKFKKGKEEPYEMMDNWGMQMDMDHMQMNHGEMNHMEMSDDDMDHSNHDMGDNNDHENHSDKSMNMSHGEDHSQHQMEKDTSMNMSHDHHQMAGSMPQDSMDHQTMQHQDHEMKGMPDMGHKDLFAEYNYDYLKATESTQIHSDGEPREILLNLTGNMWRYIWSMNGVPLSETDKIKVNKGEKVRITFNNLTMMHHPMHLHGHFFRVINENGSHSPLKHTVNVAPMQKTVIEFDASEDGDWFLHCHVLYHMMGGMARVVSYGTPRDVRLAPFPLTKIINEGNHHYAWGTLEAMSQMMELNLTSSNIRNQFTLDLEYGYENSMEADLTYEYYLYDYLRVFAGANFENEEEDNLSGIETTAIGGIRFFTPYMFDLDLRIDNKLRPQVSLARELNLFQRTNVFGEIEYQMDFGWSGDNEALRSGNADYEEELVWSAGIEYFLSLNFSLVANYDNRFGAGGGLSIRF